jgi:hypothetical protein
VDRPTLALLLTFLVHVLGIAALFWLALDGSRFDWRGWWPGDDGGDGGSEPPSAPGGGPGGDGLPLPSAEPATLRLRTAHERLADVRRRTRRPVHAPEPGRTREPAG